MNAWKELTEKLREINKTIDDIDYFGIIYKPSYTRIIRDIEELKEIDYDDSDDARYIYGFIMFKDRTWLERHEYNYMEWWAYKKLISKDFVYKEGEDVGKYLVKLRRI